MKLRFRHAASALLAAASLIGVAIPAAGTTSAAAPCQTDCLRVYSIKIYDYLGPTAEAHVKVVDETGGAVRGAVVQGVWTEPDGTEHSRYDIIGTRLRAEFPINSDQTGTLTFTVADITKAGYTFDPARSALLSSSIEIGGEPSTGCLLDCVSVSDIRMSERKGEVRAIARAVDENGSAVSAATVAATWTLPDGTTITQSKSTNRRGKVRLAVPSTLTGTYVLRIDGVTAVGLVYDPESGVETGSIAVD